MSALEKILGLGEPGSGSNPRPPAKCAKPSRPFGWELRVKCYKGKRRHLTLAFKQDEQSPFVVVLINRRGTITAARRAARLLIGFYSIEEETPYATHEAYVRAFGEGPM